ncbi:Tetratricopeptide repeat protein OS=Streptomyces tendae OX=1932 GN=F3L20_09420 PE=4 SV=1 [Streptomyces tendae]
MEAGPDPLHEVYDFANGGQQAPADSPLAILPVIAHAERYRSLAAAWGMNPPTRSPPATGPGAAPGR